ncbi:MAG: hypothetical protein L3J37_02415 [Rhodobacteraceae bacterium]|nr:hypothetical protein [Paracoccaceae bacterium]
MTVGRSVVYGVEGVVLGREAYRKNSNKLILRLSGGRCISGKWFMEQTTYCFNWEGAPPSCSRYKMLDGRIYAVAVENGVETGYIRTVVEISNEPMTCNP